MARSKNAPIRKYGKVVGAAFHARLADIWAAQNVDELLLWRIYESRSNQFEVPLAEGFSLIFESNHFTDREAASEAKVDWKKVTRVQLLEVVRNA